MQNSNQIAKKTNIRNISFLIKELIKKKNIEISIKDKNIYTFSPLNFFLRFFLKIFISLRKPILITDGYFCLRDRISFFIKSRGKILILDAKNVFADFNSSKFYYDKRKSLNINPKDEVDEIFSKLLKYILPKSFLENFRLYSKSSDFFLKNIKILGSSINIHTNDGYKFTASKFSKNKKLILGFQHGHGYNLIENNIIEKIEISNSDKYFYWNNRNGLGLNYLNRFTNKIKTNKKINKKKIFFFNDTMETDLYYFDNFLLYRDFTIKKKINNFQEFYKNIKQKKNFYFKILKRDQHHFYKIKKMKAQITSSKKIDKIFRDTRIFVSDVFSTATVEALYLDIPTVLILNKDLNIYGFKKEIRTILIKLKKYGFIQFNTKVAAKFISKIYDNVDNYWKNKNLRLLVSQLKKQLFKINPTYISDMNSNLKNLIKHHK